MNESSQEERPSDISLVGWSLAFGIMSIIIVTGNSIAIAVLTRRRLLRRRTSYFLLSLAVADMTVGIFSVPAFIYQFVSFWQHGSVSKSTLLNIVKAMDVFCGLGSTFTLTIIALERVYAICFPIRHRTSTKRLYHALVSCVWILATLLSSLYFFHEYDLIEHKVFFWFLILTFFSSMLVMLLAYLAIWIKARVQQMYFREASVESSGAGSDRKRLPCINENSSRDRSRRAIENDRKLSLTVFIVTTVFILTWLPFHVINLIVFLRCKSFPCLAQPSHQLIYTVKLLHYTNSILNPVIYSLRLQDFRSTLKKFLYRKGWCVSGSPLLFSKISWVMERSNAHAYSANLQTIWRVSMLYSTS